MPPDTRSRFARLWRGLRATLPVGLSIIPFGIAFGAVAGQTMPRWQAQLMSLTVFAGTAQFITASMLAQGIAYWPILITGLLINARLLLLSAALTTRLPGLPRTLHPFAAQLLTDESFAVSMAEFEQRPPDLAFYIGSGVCIYVIWQMATLAGSLFGANIPEGLGLEFALPSTLICLLFLLVRTRRVALIAGVSALLSLLFFWLALGTWSVMAATFIAATLGVLGGRWTKRRG